MKVILTDEEVARTIELLSRTKDVRALQMITRLRELSKDTPQADAYREAAMEMVRHEEGLCEVDSQATVSISTEGAYVQSWIFVDKEAVKKDFSHR